MIERYYKYKIKYDNYIVMIKVGNFYEVIGKDSFIMNCLFNYKIKRISDSIKCGFPVNRVINVINRLDVEHINYYIDDIDKIGEFDDNKYSNYSYDEKIVRYNLIRIDNIINYLCDNIVNDIVIDKFEGIINEG